MNIRSILVWTLRIVLAGVFLLSATQKFIDDPQYVDEFRKVSFGDWFRYFTGGLEVLGAGAMLFPRTTPWGAAILLMVTSGALIAQLTVLHGAWLHCVIIAAPLLILIWLTIGIHVRKA
jgi:putative oxidoreductase